MILDPYSTSYGKLLNIGITKRELSKYTVITRDNLEYEYRSSEKMKTYFITGYNRLEAEITPFDHPVIIEDTKVPVVYTDLRKYVKSMKDNTYEIIPSYITDISRDSSSINLLITRAIATRDFYLGYMGLYRKFFKPYVQSFSTIITYAVDSIIKLNPVERADVIYASAAYAYNMLFNKNSLENLLEQNVAFVTNTKLGIPSDRDYAKDKISSLNIFHSGMNINNLVDGIKSMLPDGKGNYITIDTIANILTNLWFGHSGGEIILIGLEHAPSWLSLSLSALTDNVYKKSRLTQILQNNKNISIAELSKEYNLFIKERIIS